MIGLFGGTFDPVHLGHLRMALEVREALGLREVRFIPCYSPPHRDPADATPEDRLAMLKAAVADESGFVVDTREYDRDGPSYTVDTLSSLRQELPGESLCLMMGMDAFVSLPGWSRWDRILDFAHIVVFHRNGIALPELGPLVGFFAEHHVTDPAALKARPAGHIWVQDVTPLNISATAIRADLSQGGSVRYLVPDNVLAYIQSNGLYGASMRQAASLTKKV
ncbi:MAG: nicotinate-nucleotide adenylyltransferase [Gammaproteobacteria bacterium]|nr:nicotinate-nucleotide adenylyltransferase [Gammaproteobacteria bacterium]